MPIENCNEHVQNNIHISKALKALIPFCTDFEVSEGLEALISGTEDRIINSIPLPRREDVLAYQRGTIHDKVRLIKEYKSGHTNANIPVVMFKERFLQAVELMKDLERQAM
jgi:hypothetical protein